MKEWANLFSEVGKSTELASNFVVGLERFVCRICGWPTYDDINILRYDLFDSHYEAHLESKLFSVVEGIDLFLLPPAVLL